MIRINAFGIALVLFSLLMSQAIAWGGDEHLMIPMRDGKKTFGVSFCSRR